jgi:hypothetical protein
LKGTWLHMPCNPRGANGRLCRKDVTTQLAMHFRQKEQGSPPNVNKEIN